MTRSVVITDADAITPLGETPAAILAALEAGTMGDHAPVARIAGGSRADTARLNARLSRKLDGFCIKSLELAGAVIERSRIGPDSAARVGIYVGNCLGGWSRIEQEIRDLHLQGSEAVGPYVATAWFPAALQGQISLLYGFKGRSKTFSTWDVAGVQALGHAAAAIRSGVLDAAVVCAGEDLSSTLVQRALEAARRAPGYATFAPDGAATVSNESAVCVLLESADFAQTRGARARAEITGFTERYCADDSQLEAALRAHLAGAEARRVKADGRFPSETRALDRILGAAWADATHCHGNLHSAGGLLDVALEAHAPSRSARTTFHRMSPEGCSVAVTTDRTTLH
jgi:3-oxoacyl-[acyl-carrier-protein] synthase II